MKYRTVEKNYFFQLLLMSFHIRALFPLFQILKMELTQAFMTRIRRAIHPLIIPRDLFVRSSRLEFQNQPRDVKSTFLSDMEAHR